MTTTHVRTETVSLPGPSTRWREMVFLPHVISFAATLVIVPLFEPRTGLALLSIVSCAFSVAIALRRGGPYLLPSSVYFMGAGVFIGGAGYYLLRVSTEVPIALIRDASALALLSTIATAMVTTAVSVGWRLRWSWSAQPIDRTPPPRQFNIRALAMVVFSQLSFVAIDLGPITRAAGLAGVLMLVIAASAKRLHIRWGWELALVAVAAIAPTIFILRDFTGGGRMKIAGLAIAVFVGWNLVRPSRFQKVLVILAIPVFLAFAGINRLEINDNNKGDTGSSVVSGGDGLGSVYGPLETWARMIGPLEPEQHSALGPRYGATYLNTFYLPIPRIIWADKPKGFGAELTEVLEPQLVRKEHSMAALAQGEWYANFGYPGLILMVPFVGFALALLDRVHARFVRDGLDQPAAWWQVVALLCVVSSLADYSWVGLFMLYARGGLAAVVVLLVGWSSTWRQTSNGAPNRWSAHSAVPDGGNPSPWPPRDDVGGGPSESHPNRPSRMQL